MIQSGVNSILYAYSYLPLLADAIRQMTATGMAFLKQLEGLRLKPYRDGNGYAIGWGHFIEPGEEWMMNGITQAQADAILLQDIATAEEAVSKTITVEGSPQFFDALMMFAYNIGADNFRTSRLAAMVNDPTVTDAQVQAYWATTWVGSPPKQILLDRRENEINYAYNAVDPDTIIVTASKSSSSWGWWIAAIAAGVYIHSKS